MADARTAYFLNEIRGSGGCGLEYDEWSIAPPGAGLPSSSPGTAASAGFVEAF
jgi:hypothetical protein